MIINSTPPGNTSTGISASKSKSQPASSSQLIFFEGVFGAEGFSSRKNTIHKLTHARQVLPPFSQPQLDHASSNIRFNILKDPSIVTPTPLPHSLMEFHFSRPVRSYRDADFLRSVVATYLDPVLSSEPLEEGLRSSLCDALDRLIESNTGHRMASKEELQEHEEKNIPQERFRVLAGDSADLERAISTIEAADWSLFKTEDFTRMVTVNKAQSVALQLHISSSDNINESLLDLAIRSVDVLCVDKFGCYLMCKMVAKSLRLKSFVEQYARQSLVKLASSQHGRRDGFILTRKWKCRCAEERT